MSPEERAARERKQKIFVVVGGILLLGLLAFQLPKLLGGSSAPEATPTTQTTADAPVAEQPVAGQPVSGAVPAPHASAPVDDSAKLRSFSAFAPKDPFVQQVVTPVATTAQGTGAAKEKAKAAAGKAKPAPAAPSKGFSTTPAATATVVSVNGVRQTLVPGAKFPTADPMFVLVDEQPGSKSVVVGVAGGAYESGAKTTKLRVGKPLVLVNTTTGARYRILLVSVGNGQAPAAKLPSAKPAAKAP